MIILLLYLSKLYPPIRAVVTTSSPIIVLVTQLAYIVTVSSLYVYQVSIMNLWHRPLTIKHICIQILSPIYFLRQLLVTILQIDILPLTSLFGNAHLILLLKLLIEYGVLVIVHDVAVVEVGTHEITLLSVGVTYASDDVAVWGKLSYLSNLLLFPIRHLLQG